ncbi:IS110 family transposase, partial [Microbacterium sp. F2E]|uniref:IS110 family transposase n=1 Tax=Microbacterium sp. F2E TaxID=2895284 RepID=UPI001E3C9DC5
AKTHTLAILAAPLGELVDTAQFPTTHAGLQRAIDWAGRRTGADLDVLWVIEGIGSYGARLAQTVAQTGYQVAEAPRMNARTNRGVGKSDPLDARRIAAAALPLEITHLRSPRDDDGERAALRVLVTAREHMTTERTGTINALTALLRTVNLGIDARRPLTSTQVTEITRWRARAETVAAATARAEAIRLAKRVTALNDELAENRLRMEALVHATPAATLLDEPGIGVVTAAITMTAWSHVGRLRSEAAFASLAGVNPIPASSGNTARHRLNRGGDRRLNRALHMAVVTRMRCDPATRAYVERRRTEGRTNKEIRRCLKRYLARRIYRQLNRAVTPT